MTSPIQEETRSFWAVPRIAGLERTCHRPAMHSSVGTLDINSGTRLSRLCQSPWPSSRNSLHISDKVLSGNLSLQFGFTIGSVFLLRI